MGNLAKAAPLTMWKRSYGSGRSHIHIIYIIFIQFYTFSWTIRKKILIGHPSWMPWTFRPLPCLHCFPTWYFNSKWSPTLASCTRTMPRSNQMSKWLPWRGTGSFPLILRQCNSCKKLVETAPDFKGAGDVMWSLHFHLVPSCHIPLSQISTPYATVSSTFCFWT